MSDFRVSRRPYTIQYYNLQGEKKSIRRVPPPKLHDALPQDQVELTRGKNSNFVAEEVYKVKHINPRHANTLQLENEDGKTTFVSYLDIKLDRKLAPRDGVAPLDQEENNEYLLWP